MDNEQIKNLCLSLMHADTEDEVIALLKGAGYWDNPDVWRYYGDDDSNASIIGSQMSEPEPAIVEKLTNAVDACLINECLIRGIPTDSDDAPKSITEAVGRFYDEGVKSELAGQIKEWDKTKRTNVSMNITLAATGNKNNPCITISDQGEGQTPNNIPYTFLSLHRGNKVKIQFVQGKFNMGGSGALDFCGKNRMQLVISRRNPKLVDGNSGDSTDMHWGFTIVRRERPTGGLRVPVYKYLAPIKTTKEMKVLSFKSEALPIFHKYDDAYTREAEHGSLIKLYEYRYKNQSHILMKDGLLMKLDLLLPDIALPIRLHECRGYKGIKERSFTTTMSGLGVRLSDDSKDKLEPGFPTSSPLRVLGHDMSVTIYAFKKGAASAYKRSEGIIFTVNGQTHANMPSNFFRRKKVGLGFLDDSILVVIDCSMLNEIDRYDLFMNSRDRLRKAELLSDIESQLEELLKKHTLLKELKERRKREEIESKLDDNKPLEEMLDDILKKSPTLSALFLFGKKLSNPFKTKEVAQEEKEYEGKKYPTYFKFKGKEPGEQLSKNCHINMRCRVQFETDADNDYFSRKVDKGEFELHQVIDGSMLPVESFVGPNLENGLATLSISLPSTCSVGDALKLVAKVNDSTQMEPFVNELVLSVKEEHMPKPGTKTRKKPPAENEGDAREIPMGISLPQIIPVYEQDWESHGFKKYSAVKLRTDSIDSEADDEQQEFSFFINMDNIYLKTEMKGSAYNHEFIEARFKYAMVLLGLAVIHDSLTKKKNGDELDSDEEGQETMEDKVKYFCDAVAPIVIPMIEYLGGELNLPETVSEYEGTAE